MEEGELRFKLSVLGGVILLACAVADFASRLPVTDARPTREPSPAAPWKLGDERDAVLSHQRLKPGDPVLTVDAPEGTAAVVAELPFGQTKLCRPDAGRKRWACRFLVPRWTADGEYAIKIAAIGRDGSRIAYSARYVVDSRAPVLAVKAERRGGELVFLARPKEHVVETRRGPAGASRRHDVKSLTLLYGGRRVPLRLDRRAGSFLWTARVPAQQGGAILEAVDFAGNSHRQAVALP